MKRGMIPSIIKQLQPLFWIMVLAFSAPTKSVFGAANSQLPLPKGLTCNYLIKLKTGESFAIHLIIDSVSTQEIIAKAYLNDSHKNNPKIWIFKQLSFLETQTFYFPSHNLLAQDTFVFWNYSPFWISQRQMQNIQRYKAGFLHFPYVDSLDTMHLKTWFRLKNDSSELFVQWVSSHQSNNGKYYPSITLESEINAKVIILTHFKTPLIYFFKNAASPISLLTLTKIDLP